MPTRHPRKMVTLTPDRAALLDEVATLEGDRPDLGGLIEEGARARLERLRRASAPTQAARRRLADRIRERSLGQDVDAADRVKHLGSRGVTVRRCYWTTRPGRASSLLR